MAGRQYLSRRFWRNIWSECLRAIGNSEEKYQEKTHEVDYGAIKSLFKFKQLLNSWRKLIGKFTPCSLQIELFAGKGSACDEAILSAVPCGEEGLVGTGEGAGDCFTIFFVSLDLAAAAAMRIISCTC